MTMIPYACATVTLPTLAFLADKWKKRAIPLLLCLGISLIGFIMLLASTNTPVLLAGCCFVAAGSYPDVVIGASWQMASHGGFTKRATAWAVSQAVIQAFSIAATQVYTTPPRFFKGHGTLLGLNTVGVIAAMLQYWIMKRENFKKEQRAAEYAREGREDPENEKSLEDLCDRHPQFRYVL